MEQFSFIVAFTVVGLIVLIGPMFLWQRYLRYEEKADYAETRVRKLDDEVADLRTKVIRLTTWRNYTFNIEDDKNP